jgi:hypothetical protein
VSDTPGAGEKQGIGVYVPKAENCQNIGAFPKTRLVLWKALEKTV